MSSKELGLRDSAVGKHMHGWIPLLIQPLTDVLNESKDPFLILHEILGGLLFVHSVTWDNLSYSFPSLLGTGYNIISNNVLIYSAVNCTPIIVYIIE